MSKNFPQMATELTRAIGTMRKGIPETMEGFSAMAKAAIPRALFADILRRIDRLRLRPARA